jgi:nicotinamide-nucleotide amidase
MSSTAELIAVGTEILLGNIVNTDARDISQMLSEIGINVYYHTTVGDNPERLKEAVEIAKSRADVIITTGGLGPTCDDLTKQTLAQCFGLELKFDDRAMEDMKKYFMDRLHTCNMTENNKLQAYLPEGCTPFYNTCGTAPGCGFEAQGKTVVMLPGPPRECNTMFRLSAMPYLKKLSEGEIVSHNIRIFGMGESAVEDKLHDMMVELTNPTLAPYAKEAEVMLRVTAKADSVDEAEKMMEPVIQKVIDTLGDVIYAIDADSLEDTVLHLLKEEGKTLAAAESCTGGLLAKRITDIPGASEVFLGGAVTYCNDAKAKMLGVDPGLIAEKGPVSREVAVEMAKGIRKNLGADIGIGITGIAGPASDETGREVGTVFVAMAVPGDMTYFRSLSLGSDRQRCRTAAVHNAFDMVRRFLTGLPI